MSDQSGSTHLRLIRFWTSALIVVVIAACGLARTGTVPAAEAVSSGPPSDQVTDKDRQFWAFQKLVRTAVPQVRATGRVRNPVDSFVLAQLEQKGLSYAPEADRLTLLRRVSLDLIGLPPTPEQFASFLADGSPLAYENLVDRLLASPQFGERWGRHWLDVAGYVDTVGFDVDVDLIITSERKWLYRDYVIRAFNEDKTYDRFLHEQLAGDELVDWRRAAKFTSEIRELLVATGFLRNAPDFTHEDVGNIPQNHFGILHDTLEIVGSSVFGLTLNCARCHNHKFDPLPQQDYYRLMAVFAPAYNPNDWKIVIPYDAKLPDRTLADVSLPDRAEIERHNAEIDKQLADLTQKREELRQPYRERLLEQKLAAIPESIRADVKAAVDLPADKRSEVQTYLANKFSNQLKVADKDIATAFSDADKAIEADNVSQSKQLTGRKKSFGKIQALYDVGPLPVSRLLIRGNYETPGDEVTPGYLRVLCEGDAAATMSATAPFAGTSGRRRELARWLTSRDTRAAGLVSRVMVNRFWQHLFQTGLVPTPENFGFGGMAPTNPPLMEWLSTEFAESGWQMKSLLRRLVCSSAYRQSAESPSNPDSAVAVTPKPAEVDPDNRLLWRMPLKRLDSEVIRDCTLAASGTLDSTMGGAPVMLEGKPDGMIVVAEKQLSTPTSKWRRSVYLLSRRAFQLSELTVFDQPVVATNCPERGRSAVPLQSLTMLNGAFLWEQAEQAARLIDPLQPVTDRIAAVFQRVLVRAPTPDELRHSNDYLTQQSVLYREKGLEPNAAAQKAFVHLCHTLLNTSEFLYTP